MILSFDQAREPQTILLVSVKINQKPTWTDSNARIGIFTVQPTVRGIKKNGIDFHSLITFHY